ncbi:MAG: TrmH family RNA methyltransferase [Propionibacteriaceae bacterium]
MAERGNDDVLGTEVVAPVDPQSQLTDDDNGPFWVPGVGPWEGDIPDDPRFDPVLLAEGDRRNVIDEFRYLTVEAIVEELSARRSPLHVAIQNFQHDFNIGSIVRTANAFNVSAVHIVGKRRWNRRGAMVTDRYIEVIHHDDEEDLFAWLAAHGLTPIGIDNLPGSVPLETTTLPEQACLIFGSEGPGLTEGMVAGVAKLCHITMHGSTRSFNAGAAAAIAMYHWGLQHTPKMGL